MWKLPYAVGGTLKKKKKKKKKKREKSVVQALVPMVRVVGEWLEA